MPDLDSILQEFASFIEDELPPPDVERLVGTAPVRPTRRPRWRPVVAFVAAALAVLVVGMPLLMFGVFSSAPVAELSTTPTVPVTTQTEPLATPTGPVTTTIAPVTATTTAIVDSGQEEWMAEQGPAALALVEDYYATLNAGDVGAALSMVSGSMPGNLSSTLQIGVEGLGTKFVVDCSISESRHHIVCSEVVTDNLYGPAGITLNSHVGYTTTSNGTIQLIVDGYGNPACSGDPTGSAGTYLLDLYAWIVETHPELERNFTGTLSMGTLGIPCTPYPFSRAENASEISDVVPEFVAQSDRYPVEPPPGAVVTELPGSIMLWDYEDSPTSLSFRNDDLLFSLSQSCADCFGASKEMTREPNGVLTAEGWRAGIWTVGPAGQTEINHLWPPDTAIGTDVLWLTDYTGMTADTLTGFTPEPGDTFTLWDQLVLEPRGAGKGMFGLHADCRTGDQQIGAVLFSFEGHTAIPLIGWTIDYDSMTFVRVNDPSSIQLGNCYEPAPRP